MNIYKKIFINKYITQIKIYSRHKILKKIKKIVEINYRKVK